VKRWTSGDGRNFANEKFGKSRALLGGSPLQHAMNIIGDVAELNHL